MRRLLFLMPILLCAAVSAHAQSLDAFKQRLAEPTPGATLFNRAQVTVTEHDDAARAVADAARAGQRLYFEGFHRVCVFSDKRACGARRGFAAKALFEETYPDVKVYVDYEIPYFIVSAGNCLTKEEAIMLKGRVSATFPKAFSQAAEEGEIPDFQPFGPIKVRFRKIIFFSLLFPGEYLTLRRYGTINN